MRLRHPSPAVVGLITTLAACSSCGSGSPSTPSPSPAPSLPPGVTAVVQDGRVLPLYRVDAAGAAATALAFDVAGNTVAARDAAGRETWRLAPGAAIQLAYGTFDHDADGWPDFALARYEETGEICGSTPRRRSWLDLVSGRTGATIRATDPTADICWDFAGTTYPTSQWAEATVISGPGSPLLSLQPYYATRGRVVAPSGGSVQTRSEFVFPSTAEWKAYPGAQDPVAYSHVALGFLLGGAVQPRLVFYTSGRVVGLDVSAPAARLLFDRTFRVGGRRDTAGRLKGLVALEPGEGGMWVFSGTDARSLYCDLRQGAVLTDPWARVERHVTRFDLASTSVQHRFYSYAYDHGSRDQYEGRVAFPAGALVPAAEGGAHGFYNVYEGGRWRLHVTQSARVEDLQVVPDVYLWDARDVDGDGTAEFLLSPAADAGPAGFARYFPEWRTEVHSWDEAAHALRRRLVIEGAVPEIAPAMKQKGDALMSFVGPYYPALSVARDGRAALLLRTRAGLRAQPLDGSAGVDLGPGGSTIEGVCATTAAP